LNQDNYIHGMDWTFMHENGLGSLKNYRAYQFNLIAGQFGADVLEVGSGDRGFTAEILKKHKQLNRLVSIEPSEGLYQQHQDNFKFPENVTFDNKDLFHVNPNTYGMFDSALFIHVLEHIENDRAALDHTSTLVKSGGSVLIEVPALPFLFSDHDRLLGHYRRYTKKMLRSAINPELYSIKRMWYNDPIGVAGSFIFFKLLKKKLNTNEGADLVKNQGGIYDKYIIPMEAKLEQFVTFPFGLSLTAILERK
jgi:hypothetical protein